MDIIVEIRRRHLVSGESVSVIARNLNLSRPTVRKHLHSTTAPVYECQQQPALKLGEFQPMLETWLKPEQHLPKAQRRTARRLHEGLQVASSFTSQDLARTQLPGQLSASMPRSQVINR